jgi:Domain of unknown function (DUF5615)
VKFLADECFSNSIVRALVAAGFDVKRSQELLPGAADELVLALAYTTVASKPVVGAFIHGSLDFIGMVRGVLGWLMGVSRS